MVNFFRLDRKDPPLTFYTVKGGLIAHVLNPGTDVLAECAEHNSPEFHMFMGLVSKQAPFGQYRCLGFSKSELRAATPAEIRAALQRNHPNGSDFVPIPLDDMDEAEYQKLRDNWPSIAEQQLKTVLETLPQE